ncbi:MAG: hypothetical protein IKF71_03535 [Bacilli bacterium]|nr:hypothetical protein [Bacilli bacterium]
MKRKIGFVLLIGLFFLTGCMFQQKEQLKEYLRNNQYEPRKNCLQKTNNKDQGGVLQRFCLEECKYYASDFSLDDFFTLDIQEQEIHYIYDYVTYQYKIKSKKTICLFQGEEIDLDSSYCKTAKIIVEQHLELFQQELQKANVKERFICK